MEITASFASKGTSRDAAIQSARAFVKNGHLLRRLDGLKYAGVAQVVVRFLSSGPKPASQISEKIRSVIGENLTTIAEDATFLAEESSLTDTVVAAKLLSNSLGVDVAGFAELLKGYDAMRRSTTASNVGLRFLALDSYPAPPPETKSTPAARGITSLKQENLQDLPTVKDYDEALARLSNLTTRDFAVTKPTSVSRLTGRTHVFGGGTSAWRLSTNAVASLPSNLQTTLSSVGIDLTAVSLITAMNTLYEKRVAKLTELAQRAIPMATTVHKMGAIFKSIDSSDYVGEPSTSLGFGSSSVRPVGIGDLLLVREHVIRYEGGELAHTENVMKSEKISRSTRRLDRTEASVTQETETTNEHTTDTQTTERFDLKRETSDTIKFDGQLKAGLAVDSKYGPMTEIKANTDLSTSTSMESATKLGSEFSK